MIDYAKAPNNLGDSFQRCVEKGIPMPEIVEWFYVEWLYNCAPMGCWGSEERVKAWTDHKKYE